MYFFPLQVCKNPYSDSIGNLFSGQGKFEWKFNWAQDRHKFYLPLFFLTIAWKGLCYKYFSGSLNHVQKAFSHHVLRAESSGSHNLYIKL